jgi:chemotaxis protein MotA
MVVIIGFVIIIGLTCLGFVMNGGNPAGLYHTGEVIPIFGMGAGALVIMAPVKTLKGIVHGLTATLKGAPYNKANYEELLKCLYELFVLGRRGGMIALEEHVMNPTGSSLFKKYPKFYGNHHAMDFLVDYLRLMVGGNLKAFEIENLMDNEIETHHHEGEAPIGAVSRVGDGLPAFGIVAAVMGVVKTMSSVGAPPEILGAKIGAALVGTFLGILLAYGFVGPLASLLEQKLDEQTKMLQCIKVTLLASLNGYPPQVAVEFGRKVLYSTERPSFSELEEEVKQRKGK